MACEHRLFLTSKTISDELSLKKPETNKRKPNKNPQNKQTQKTTATPPKPKKGLQGKKHKKNPKQPSKQKPTVSSLSLPAMHQ